MADEFMPGALYRLSWQMVGHAHLRLYCNADPTFYKNTTQVVPNSEIPDEHWHEVSKHTGNPWQQYNQLRKWSDADEGFVRNVRLERQVSEPRWEPVEESHAASPGPAALDEEV